MKSHSMCVQAATARAWNCIRTAAGGCRSARTVFPLNLLHGALLSFRSPEPHGREALSHSARAIPQPSSLPTCAVCETEQGTRVVLHLARAVSGGLHRMRRLGVILESESRTMKAPFRKTGPRLLASAPLGRRASLRFCRLLPPGPHPSCPASSRPHVSAWVRCGRCKEALILLRRELPARNRSDHDRFVIDQTPGYGGVAAQQSASTHCPGNVRSRLRSTPTQPIDIPQTSPTRNDL